MKNIENRMILSGSNAELIHRLETIIDSSSDGIWVCDGKGIVVTINKASERLNGIQAEEVIGFDVKSLLEKNVFDKSVTTLVLETGDRETILQHVNKTDRLLLLTATPTFDDEGNIQLVVVNERDMTELDKLQKQYKQSQKVNEKYREKLTGLSLLELERHTIIADSNKMQQILQMSLKLSHLGATNILITGASGTGKGLLAKVIHKNSTRKNNPFIELNCAALPENLLEAELFGYEKGAFTGASEKGKAGLFELAQGGTLFLDEIGDMSINLQTKLLKYLDDKQFRRVGGTKIIQVECITIAATNRDLLERVRKNLFREDLYYRLSSFTLDIPSLCDRIDDIPGLVRFYLEKYNKKYDTMKMVGSTAMSSLQNYSFPGNIRELKNILENAVVLSDDDGIDGYILAAVDGNPSGELSSDPEGGGTRPTDLTTALNQVERQLLLRAKKNCRTTRQIAEYLNISQPSVVRKLKKYDL